MIDEKKTDMNKELFQKHFNFGNQSVMLRDLFRTNNKRKNKQLVGLIKSGLSHLKEDIEQMSENEIEVEKPYEMVDIIEMIFEVNRQNQEGKGLKILTLEQMLSRLPISLAQLKAGNNSGKLKNETRQLLYSLHRSKMLSKTIYKQLVSII